MPITITNPINCPATHAIVTSLITKICWNNAAEKNPTKNGIRNLKKFMLVFAYTNVRKPAENIAVFDVTMSIIAIFKPKNFLAFDLWPETL